MYMYTKRSAINISHGYNVAVCDCSRVHVPYESPASPPWIVGWCSIGPPGTGCCLAA